MTYVLGLDFGTSFTAAAAAAPGGHSARVVTLGNRAAAVPSALFLRADGTQLFGEDAYLRGGAEPTRLIRNLKRRLGDSAPIVLADRMADRAGGGAGGTSFLAEDLVADYLRWVVGRVAEREGGPPERLVLTHPANWRSFRLAAFQRAAAAAGLDAATFVTEPYAAVAFHAAAHPLAVGGLVAAYDLGGGTFDAAVLRHTATGFELAGEPEGVEHLGGVDVDDTVFHLVRTKLGATWTEAERAGGPAFAGAATGLLRECTAAKEALSGEPEVEVPVVLPGVNTSVRITRSELEQLIGPAVADTIGAFRRAVRAAGARPEELEAVLLVGGSSRIPLVRAAVTVVVGPTVTILDADPRHAVARGAALLAAASAPVADHAPAAAVGTVATGGGVAVAAVPVAASVAAAADTAPAASASTTSAATPDATDAPPPIGAGPNDGAPPADRRRRLLFVVAALVGVLAGIAGVFAISRSGDDAPTGTLTAGSETTTSGDPATDGDPSNDATAAGGSGDAQTATPTVIASGVGMVAIPAGAYPVGSTTPGAEAAAARSATLETFNIDVLEVLNADYNRFVQTQGAPAARSWPQGRMPDAQADHPVRGVEWAWAQAYCLALGKRLPGDAEWEAAARGPAGLPFPWGVQADLVDLDTPGSRPAGSTAGNVSPFGVQDTVGGAWEWVDQPYEPVADGQVVRRGGEYGRVRGGATMRQAVSVTNESAITETGFRCAADRVDPTKAPGEFSDEHPHPDEVTTPTASTAVPSGPTTVLVDDTFENPRSGWPEQSGPDWKVGYHAPTWYHVEAGRAGVQVLALGGFNYADATVEAAVYVDKWATAAGRFRYGLAFRAHGARSAPDSGGGNDRPENFYAFVIDPRAQRWELLHDDTLPLRRQLDGPLPAVKVVDGTAPDRLKVEMRGDKMTLAINGEVVGAFDTHGYHLNGDLGLYVESLDETKPHVHFDELKVTPL